MLLNYTEGVGTSADEDEFLHRLDALRRLQAEVKIFQRNIDDFYFVLFTVITFSILFKEIK